ncbi:hypothetical protein V7024_18465 [Bacillus sp. JJ864]|uniref:hypothetical protein n=1 Tax=Bacillus sp. JJ864 TaxID=3122975 RepID=UPI002FFFFF91
MIPEPNWQPISALSMIANMIDGQLEDAQEQYTRLLEAQPTPHILDDYTIHRTIQVYTDQLEFVPIYKTQLKKWQLEAHTTSIQQSEIKRLQEQMKKWENILNSILHLASELKEGTIENMLSKSDWELGIQGLQKHNNSKRY